MNADDMAAILGAAAALVGAISALVLQLRELRKDIVRSVEAHMNATLDAMHDMRGPTNER